MNPLSLARYNLAIRYAPITTWHMDASQKILQERGGGGALPLPAGIADMFPALHLNNGNAIRQNDLPCRSQNCRVDDSCVLWCVVCVVRVRAASLALGLLSTMFVGCVVCLVCCGCVVWFRGVCVRGVHGSWALAHCVWVLCFAARIARAVCSSLGSWALVCRVSVLCHAVCVCGVLGSWTLVHRVCGVCHVVWAGRKLVCGGGGRWHRSQFSEPSPASLVAMSRRFLGSQRGFLVPLETFGWCVDGSE